MENIDDRLFLLGVVPVVVIKDSDKAVPLAKALIAGGLPCAEVTFRTDAAEESIKRVASAFPEMLLGAGTVLSVEQAKRALDAGAQFIVAPGFDPELVDWCIGQNVPVYPGCVTPSEITQVYKRGLRVAKFFPASQFGGVNTCKALAAPFTGMKFLPTGGVNANNLKDYLSASCVAAVGGTWLAKSDVLEAEDFSTIEALAREAVELVSEVRG